MADETVKLARSWRLVWRGYSWGPRDLMAGDLLVVSELLERDDWRIADPTTGPRVHMAMLTALIAHHVQVPLEHAQAAVATLPWHELLATLVVTDTDDDPLPEAAVGAEPEPEPEPEHVEPAPKSAPAAKRAPRSRAKAGG